MEPTSQGVTTVQKVIDKLLLKHFHGGVTADVILFEGAVFVMLNNRYTYYKPIRGVYMIKPYDMTYEIKMENWIKEEAQARDEQCAFRHKSD